MTRLVSFMPIIVAAALTSACDEKLADVAGPTPGLEPTFTSIQREIFSAADSSGRPACISCHVAANGITVANLFLGGDGAHALLVNVPSLLKPGAIRVIPGDPDNSYLVQKIEGAPGIFGDRMPQTGPYLSPGQIAIIRRWIEIGAPNN